MDETGKPQRQNSTHQIQGIPVASTGRAGIHLAQKILTFLAKSRWERIWTFRPDSLKNQALRETEVLRPMYAVWMKNGLKSSICRIHAVVTNIDELKILWRSISGARNKKLPDHEVWNSKPAPPTSALEDRMGPFSIRYISLLILISEKKLKHHNRHWWIECGEWNYLIWLCPSYKRDTVDDLHETSWIPDRLWIHD